jgi:hypothetical protein
LDSKENAAVVLVVGLVGVSVIVAGRGGLPPPWPASSGGPLAIETALIASMHIKTAVSGVERRVHISHYLLAAGPQG